MTKNKFDFSQLVCITTKSLNDLSNLGSGPMQLYFKYLSHAKRQKTNKIWATNSFMAKGLNMSESTIERHKKMLKKADFIDVKRTWSGDTKRLGKSFVSLKKLVTADKAYTIISEGIAIPSKSYAIGKRGLNALKMDKSKCLKDNNLERDKPEKPNNPIKDNNTSGMIDKSLTAQNSQGDKIIANSTGEEIERAVKELAQYAYKKSEHRVKPGHELKKILRRRIETMVIEDLDTVETASSWAKCAIDNYFDSWILDDYKGESRENFGLIKTLEKQWKSLIS